MAFGIYVHIPYCIQKCTYCDFATYEQSRIMPPEQYVELVKTEVRQKHAFFPKQKLHSLYFGGGTPSLISASLIVAVIDELAKHGFTTGPQTEITIEINPATVGVEKMQTYLAAGVNRFSVGAQTFNEDLLKAVGREHSARDTLETLQFLKKYGVNYSMDILFALPKQTLQILETDLNIGLDLDPSHISTYCLTVPEGHPLAKSRLPEEEQIEMFNLIANRLSSSGFQRYELSSFAKPSMSSQHNHLYWTNQEYWGIGMSSHSYMKDSSWGTRFWNHSSIGAYEKQIQQISQQIPQKYTDGLLRSQFEHLQKHEALTDFCHVSLRMIRGLSTNELSERFGEETAEIVIKILQKMRQNGHIQKDQDHWRLTHNGLLVSNQIFAALTFLKDDLNEI